METFLIILFSPIWILALAILIFFGLSGRVFIYFHNLCFIDQITISSPMDAPATGILGWFAICIIYFICYILFAMGKDIYEFLKRMGGTE